MLDLLFPCSQPVLRLETGSKTLPDNPTLPVPRALIPPLFAKALVSKTNSAAEGETLCSGKRQEKKNKQATKTQEGKSGEKGGSGGGGGGGLDRAMGSFR